MNRRGQQEQGPVLESGTSTRWPVRDQRWDQVPHQEGCQPLRLHVGETRQMIERVSHAECAARVADDTAELVEADR